MGSIQVWARPVRLNIPNPGWHAYFIYTDDNNRILSLSVGPAESIYGGSMLVRTGPWAPNTFDWRNDGEPAHKQLKVIYEGADAGQKWEVMKEKMTTIAQNNLYYFSEQNSNSALNSTLKQSGFSALNQFFIQREHNIWLPGLDNKQLNFVPDGSGHHVAHAEDGTLTFVVDGVGKPISFEMLAPDGGRSVAAYDGVSGQVATVDFANASRSLTARTSFNLDASSRTQLIDVGDKELWTVNVVHSDTNGFVIADIRDYTAVSNQWLAHHTLPTANLWRADSEFITDFTANGAQVVAGTTIGTNAPSWHIVGTGDFSGDGKADILLHNDNGTIHLLTMNGAQIAAGQDVGIASAWHVPQRTTSWFESLPGGKNPWGGQSP